MMGNAKIGVALVGGYCLGRTKKAKMAIGLGMFLAGRKLNLDPKQLGKLVANSPVLGALNDQVRKELVDATKTAATSALTQRMSGLTDSLHERTLDLHDEADAKSRRADESVDEEAPQEQDEQRAGTERTEEDGDEHPAPRGKAPVKSTAKSSRPAKTAKSVKSASTEPAKSGAGKAASRTGARATAGSRARKSGAGRGAATDRGGRNG